MSNLSPSGCNFKSINFPPILGMEKKLVSILETPVKIPVEDLTGF